MAQITPRKNQYALRAVFELAKRQGRGPTKTSHIADAQAIPARFLEVILNKLKHSGLIDAKRGFTGGYFLTRSPDQITVGDIMSFMQGPAPSVDCAACLSKVNCPSGRRGCAFSSMWNRVNRAIMQVYDETTIQDLLDNDRRLQGKRRQSPMRASQTKQGQRL
jgi:Rrf2 family protein